MEKNNIFNLPANTDYLFNKEKVNSILEKFIDSLKEQVPAIEQVLAKDIINGDIKIKAKELSSFLKKYFILFSTKVILFLKKIILLCL